DAERAVSIGALAGRELPLQIVELPTHIGQHLHRQHRAIGVSGNCGHTRPQALISASIISFTALSTRALAPYACCRMRRFAISESILTLDRSAKRDCSAFRTICWPSSRRAAF